MKKYALVEYEISAIQFTLDKEVIGLIIATFFKDWYSTEELPNVIDKCFESERICFFGESAKPGDFLIDHKNGDTTIINGYLFNRLYKEAE